MESESDSESPSFESACWVLFALLRGNKECRLLDTAGWVRWGRGWNTDLIMMTH